MACRLSTYTTLGIIASRTVTTAVMGCAGNFLPPLVFLEKRFEPWSCRYLVMGVTDRGWMDFNDRFNNHLLRHSPCVRPVLLLDGATTWQEVFGPLKAHRNRSCEIKTGRKLLLTGFSMQCLWWMWFLGPELRREGDQKVVHGCGFLDPNSDEKAIKEWWRVPPWNWNANIITAKISSVRASCWLARLCNTFITFYLHCVYRRVLNNGIYP